jgi:hypothetical protein
MMMTKTIATAIEPPPAREVIKTMATVAIAAATVFIVVHDDSDAPTPNVDYLVKYRLAHDGIPAEIREQARSGMKVWDECKRVLRHQSHTFIDQLRVNLCEEEQKDIIKAPEPSSPIDNLKTAMNGIIHAAMDTLRGK